MEEEVRTRRRAKRRKKQDSITRTVEQEFAKEERTGHQDNQKEDEIESVVTDSTQPMEERLEQKCAEEVKGDKGPAIRECDKDAVIRMTEQNQVYRKFIEGLSAVSDFEAEWMTQEYVRQCREVMGWTQEQAEMMECGIGWAVEARRKGRGEEKEQEQRRREEPLEEMRTESTDEPEVTSRVVDVKTGRGSASLVQGGGWTDMMSWTRHVVKARVKEMEEKENMEERETWEAKEVSRVRR